MTIAIKDFILNREPPVEEGNENTEDILSRSEAADYLAQRWGRPFSPRDFSNFISNHGNEIAELGVKPVTRSGWAVWRRSSLDLLAEKFKPRYREEVRKPRKLRKVDH